MTKTATYKVTAYRCDCHPGWRWNRANDGGDTWIVTAPELSSVPNGQLVYTTGEVADRHDHLIPVAVDNQAAVLAELSALRVAHHATNTFLDGALANNAAAQTRIAELERELALHRMVTEGGIDGLIARLNAAEATVERIKALAAWAADPTTSVAEIVDGYSYSYDQIDVADGGLLLVGEHAVYVRTDGDTPDPDGDWWMLNGSPDGDGPHQLSEVLVARHDEDTDRPVAWHNVEALITADMLAEAIAGEA